MIHRLLVMSNRNHRGFSVALAVFTSILIAAGVAWFMAREMRSNLMGNFSNEALQTRFMSYATTISTLRRLEVAQLKQTEIFERKSEVRFLWDYLQLPDVVVRATVPVEYNYYVDLNDPWSFERQGDKLVVTAPALKSSTPAANVSQLNFEVRQGSLFRNEKEVAVGLQKELTALLEQRAVFNQHLVRESARTELGKIIQDFAGPEAGLTIEIHFADDMTNTPATTH